MVYDLRPDGTRQYALALVLAIYTLPNTSEVWFEHKYFLSRGDLAERPRWSSFLQVRAFFCARFLAGVKPSWLPAWSVTCRGSAQLQGWPGRCSPLYC